MISILDIRFQISLGNKIIAYWNLTNKRQYETIVTLTYDFIAIH